MINVLNHVPFDVCVPKAEFIRQAVNASGRPSVIIESNIPFKASCCVAQHLNKYEYFARGDGFRVWVYLAPMYSYRGSPLALIGSNCFRCIMYFQANCGAVLKASPVFRLGASCEFRLAVVAQRLRPIPLRGDRRRNIQIT